MNTIADMFYETARTYPNKTAVWCENKSITYQELASKVSQYSNFLINKGVSYRDHIGIPMNNSITSVALILAAANLGVGLVPINPTMPIRAIEKAFAVANVKHIIARRAFFEHCDKTGGLEVEGSKFCIDDEYSDTMTFLKAEEMSVVRPVIKKVSGEEILIITMTSGSTGNPKPISLTQKNKHLRAMAHIDLYKITREDNILAGTPLYHSLAERLVLIPLLIGGTSVLLPRFTPNLWLDCVKEQGVTFSIAVSAQLNQIALILSKSNEIEIDTLRCVVSSSALLETNIKNILIDKLHCDFHEMYGTSEVSTVTSINFREALHKTESVGRPIPVADVVILKDNGDVAPVGEIGEIACKTSLICDGYYGMDKTFRDAMQMGYFKTGDLGFLDEESYLYFSGRKKELIITGGINVYPIDLEKCLMEISSISECAAFAFPDEKLGEIVALAIVVKEGSELSKRTIQAHCARNLADYQQPHKIFFLDELPRNTMGKLVKSKIIDYI